MRVIFDCSALTLYPLAKTGFHGGTETMVKVLASGLAAGGHDVHVVAADLDEDEQRGPNEYWWPLAYHPTRAETVVMVHSLEGAEQYSGDALVLCSNGVDPPGLDGRVAEMVAAFPVFSRMHGELLCRANPTVKSERVVVTGLGVQLGEYDLFDMGPGFVHRVPGRIWVGNDPARGLVHVLDVFDLVRERVPHATLHVTYDFDQQFERMKWHQNALAETLWECRRRLDGTPGVMLLGSVSRGAVIREQLEAQVHLWPSDPPNVGSQIHGISQMEAAAAGCALVLSDVEAFPEVFGSAAVILPTIGTFVPGADEDGSRISAADYAEEVVTLMTDPAAWAAASRASRALAEQHTWQAVVDRWLAMLEMLSGVPV